MLKKFLRGEALCEHDDMFGNLLKFSRKFPKIAVPKSIKLYKTVTGHSLFLIITFQDWFIRATVFLYVFKLLRSCLRAVWGNQFRKVLMLFIAVRSWRSDPTSTDSYCARVSMHC